MGETSGEKQRAVIVVRQRRTCVIFGAGIILGLGWETDPRLDDLMDRLTSTFSCLMIGKPKLPQGTRAPGDDWRHVESDENQPLAAEVPARRARPAQGLHALRQCLPEWKRNRLNEEEMRSEPNNDIQSISMEKE